MPTVPPVYQISKSTLSVKQDTEKNSKIHKCYQLTASQVMLLANGQIRSGHHAMHITEVNRSKQYEIRVVPDHV